MVIKTLQQPVLYMCINRTMIMILIQASISFLCDNDFAMFVAATASDVRVIPFEQLYLL